MKATKKKKKKKAKQETRKLGRASGSSIKKLNQKENEVPHLSLTYLRENEPSISQVFILSCLVIVL